MIKLYFTFGKGSKVQPIVANTIADAVHTMNDLNGRKWPGYYTENAWETVKKEAAEKQLPVAAELPTIYARSETNGSKI